MLLRKGDSVTKLNENECLRLWAADLRSDKASQYLYDKRKEYIENLVELFLANDVNQESACSMKTKVIELLVTPEGMKGKGTHKSWKENAENDFDDVIQITYVKPNVKADFKRIKTAQGYDPKIVAWIKGKYGDHVGQDMINAAHQPLHTLWIMFMQDTFPKQLRGVKS